MFSFITLLLILLILLLLVWFGKNLRPPQGGFGTRVVDPNFKPVPRPTDTFVDPPRRKVDIQVQRNAEGVPVDLLIGQRDLRLGASEQVAWRGGPSLGDLGAKVEIRFSPNSTPFGGSSFLTARSGVALSGKAIGRPKSNTPRKYTILATTQDGFLLTKTATVTSTEDPTGQEEQKYPSTARLMIRPRPEGGYGERYEDPSFEPIDRPGDVQVPPSKEVRISVVRGEGGQINIVVDPEEVSIGPNEQVAWTTGPSEGERGGKLGIRFAPNTTPFGGDTFITARGGTVFSGLPSSVAGTFPCKVLLTTPDGIFQLRQVDAKVTVTG